MTSNNREKRVTVLLNPRELAFLEQASRFEGMQLSTYIRAKAMRAAVETARSLTQEKSRPPE